MLGHCFAIQYIYVVSLQFLQSSILAEEERKLIAFLLLSSCCLVAVYCAVGWFVVCNCGTCTRISWSDSLFGHFIYITIKIDQLFCLS